MKNFIYWHLRKPCDRYVVIEGKPVVDKRGFIKRHKGPIFATLAFNRTTKNIGWSIKCPKDKFSKKIGRKIAEGRTESPSKYPNKIKQHVLRMAEKFEANYYDSQVSENNQEVDWENLPVGTLVKLKNNYKQYTEVIHKFYLTPAELSQYEGLQVQSNGYEEWPSPSLYVEDYIVPVQLLELA